MRGRWGQVMPMWGSDRRADVVAKRRAKSRNGLELPRARGAGLHVPVPRAPEKESRTTSHHRADV